MGTWEVHLRALCWCVCGRGHRLQLLSGLATPWSSLRPLSAQKIALLVEGAWEGRLIPVKS